MSGWVKFWLFLAAANAIIAIANAFERDWLQVFNSGASACLNLYIALLITERDHLAAALRPGVTR